MSALPDKLIENARILGRLEEPLVDVLAAWEAELSASVKDALATEIGEDMRILQGQLDNRRRELGGAGKQMGTDAIYNVLSGRMDQLERFQKQLEKELKDDREMAEEIRKGLRW